MRDAWDKKDGFNAGLNSSMQNDQLLRGLAGHIDGSIHGQLGASLRDNDPIRDGHTGIEGFQSPYPKLPARKASFANTVWTFAVLGPIIALLLFYAGALRQFGSVPMVLIGGVAAGAGVGAILYVALAVLGFAFKLLVVLLRWALVGGIILGVLVWLAGKF